MLDVSSIMEKASFMVFDQYRGYPKLIVTRTQANPEAARKFPLVSGVII